MLANPFACRTQLGMDAQIAIGLSTRFMDRANAGS